MKILINIFAAFILIIAISGCTSTGSYTSRITNAKLPSYLDEIAEKNMEYEGIRRNPLIVIHGFQGSRLKNTKTGQNIWGEFKGSDILLNNSEKLKQLSHPMKKGVKIDELSDNIVPDGIMKKVKITCFGVTIEAIAYDSLINTLIYGGYQPESLPLAKGKHFNSLFEFAYDWRRDLPYNARVLDKYIKEKAIYIQKQYEKLYDIKDFDVQFDIIAHSMGGLLARYYLRYGAANLPEDGSLPEITWAGGKHIDTVIIAGTPNAGYLDTFLELLNGIELLNFPPAALGTLPTYYQMLPAPSTESILYNGSNSQVDIFNPRLWDEMKWGLMNPKEDETLKILLPDVKTKEERKSVAFDHLTKCLNRAKQFIAAMKVKASPPDDVKLKLIFGHAIKTSRRAYVDKIKGNISKIEYALGDGKVLSTSALWDERTGGRWTVFVRSPITWTDITLIRAAHMGILESPVFEDNVLFHLTMTETSKQEEILSSIEN
jgi:hypothetical protein